MTITIGVTLLVVLALVALQLWTSEPTRQRVREVVYIVTISCAVVWLIHQLFQVPR